jgi:N-acetylglucosaminyldiphosphoundecaprenol N-acetyl-beta-D-mannosaminyltransferase
MVLLQLSRQQPIPRPDGWAFGFPTLTMGGLPIAVMTRTEAAAFLNAAALAPCPPGGHRPLYITSANGEVLSRAESDPAIKALFLAADMIHADGQSMVLASRLRGGTRLPERVATTDLFHDVAKLAEPSGASFYFLGSTPEGVAATVAAVRRAYPLLRIAGQHHGYFDAAEEAGVAAAIDAARPSILWIGMGVPREQAFVVRNRHRLLHVGVIKTAGGLFDFLSGRRSRAPRWMQAAGLEWLYRTMLEPRRLTMRYLTTNPHALLIMLRRPRR